MGCCTGLKNDVFVGKELIVDISPQEIENLMGSNREYSRNTQKKNLCKVSSKTAETSAESPKREKKRKKSRNYHEQIIKEVAKNLRLISINEIVNIRKFFELK